MSSARASFCPADRRPPTAGRRRSSRPRCPRGGRARRRGAVPGARRARIHHQVAVPSGDRARAGALIPAFNEDRVIVASVERVLASRDARLRVIVVDDGSTDATSRLVAERFGDDPRVGAWRRRAQDEVGGYPASALVEDRIFWHSPIPVETPRRPQDRPAARACLDGDAAGMAVPVRRARCASIWSAGPSWSARASRCATRSWPEGRRRSASGVWEGWVTGGSFDDWAPVSRAAGGAPPHSPALPGQPRRPPAGARPE